MPAGFARCSSSSTPWWRPAASALPDRSSRPARERRWLEYNKENLTEDAFAYSSTVYSMWRNFRIFPSTVYEETLRHTELCNSFISQIQQNQPKLS